MKLLALVLNFIFAFGLVLAADISRRCGGGGGDDFEFVIKKEDTTTRKRGQNCGFTRKGGVIFNKAICEKGLTCIGVGPSEYKNHAGGAHSTNFDHYVGVCIHMSDVESV
ncbi:hypothetical protein BD770DRAFT_442638 [Pilaira anomala]|nr:hypothetical protein BD770DRAFT_442638 [Pilaira anomala]